MNNQRMGSEMKNDIFKGFLQNFGMPRKQRLEYEGALYHLMNRRDHKDEIFLNDQDRRRFLETLGEACRKTGWQIQAYCLMGNHFHPIVETTEANLSAGIQWFLGT